MSNEAPTYVNTLVIMSYAFYSPFFTVFSGFGQTLQTAHRRAKQTFPFEMGFEI